MKKILFAAAAIAAALFASCDKTDDTLDPAMPETSDTARIAITLTGADEADTRAFFDTSAKAEAPSTIAEHLSSAVTSLRRSSLPNRRPSRFPNLRPAPSAHSTP